MKLKNKIIFSLLVFVFLLLLNNSSQAYTFDYNSCTYELPITIEEDTIFIFKDTGDKIYFYVFPEGSYYYLEAEMVLLSDYVEFDYYTLSLQEGKTQYTLSDWTYEKIYPRVDDNALMLQSEVVYSSHIASWGAENTFEGKNPEDFFQFSPQNLEEVLEESLKITKEVVPETMKTELVELVPVGVMILATMILVLLVAYFPHWKG